MEVPEHGAFKPNAGNQENGKTLFLSEAFELYRRDYILFKGQSSRTEEAHQYVAKSLIGYLGSIEVEDLSFANIRDWKNELDKTRIPDTVRTYIIRVRVVLDFLKKRGYDVLDPDSIPVPKRIDRVPRYLVKEDVAKLIRTASECKGSKVNRLRNQAIISLLYCSGIRVNELCGLNRGDIVDGTFSIVGKGGKARLCFVDERTMKLINAYLKYRDDGNHALFVAVQHSKRITKGNIQFIFRRVSKKAGLENVHPHTMRHSFATNLLKNNCNLKHVQTMMGHANLQTTSAYLHVTDHDLKEAYLEFHTT